MMGSRIFGRKLIALFGVCIGMGSIVLILSAIVLAEEPGPGSTTRDSITPSATSTPEDRFREREEFRKELERHGHFHQAAGPQTAGRRIYAGGLWIKLPQDVYVANIIDSVVCVVGRPCPETPLYVLQRGSSIIAIGARSGTIDSEITEPGEEAAFDFLKDVLR